MREQLPLATFLREGGYKHLTIRKKFSRAREPITKRRGILLLCEQFPLTTFLRGCLRKLRSFHAYAQVLPREMD